MGMIQAERMATEPGAVVRFGVFEADLGTGELRKQGRRVTLQQQPFEVLKALVTRPSELVSRDDLRRLLWPDDVTVDFDQSLNKCVTKLRDALGDSAASPHFIETLPKRGYRFVAPVTVVTSARTHAAESEPAIAHPQPLAPENAAVRSAFWRPLTFVPIVLLAASVGVLLWATSRTERPAALAPSAPVSAAEGSEDAAARDAYARGRIAVLRRTEEGLRSGVDLFARAIELDPRYEAAYVGLADAWSLLASYGMVEPRDALAKARDYANRALTLNPESSEAHTSLGRTCMIADWDWKVAEWHFVRALGIRENHVTAHQWYSYMLSAVGRHAEAEREARRAAALDPLSLNAATGVGFVLYVARRFDDAAAALRRVVETDPDFRQARRNLGFALTMQGRSAEAVAEFERAVRLSGESASALAELAWARGRAGDSQGARRLLARLREKRATGFVPADSMALALWGAGRTDEAVTELESAFERRMGLIAHLATDPMWDGLREHPRVQAMADAVLRGRTALSANR